MDHCGACCWVGQAGADSQKLKFLAQPLEVTTSPNHSTHAPMPGPTIYSNSANSCKHKDPEGPVGVMRLHTNQRQTRGIYGWLDSKPGAFQSQRPRESVQSILFAWAAHSSEANVCTLDSLPCTVRRSPEEECTLVLTRLHLVLPELFHRTIMALFDVFYVSKISLRWELINHDYKIRYFLHTWETLQMNK